jgi:hypothetical protein
MYRAWTVLPFALALVFVGAGAGGRSPAARVLEVKGKVTVVEAENFERPAAVYGTVYADERLVVGKDARVALVFRGDGHVERVAAAGTFTVTPSGCQPETGVQRVDMPEQNRATIGKISKGRPGIVQGGVIMARAAAPSSSTGGGPPPEGELPVITAPGKIRPIGESTVLSMQPKFSWPAVPKAKKYTVNMYFQQKRMWKAVSEQPRVEYSGQTPLKSGAMYTWDVTTTLDGKSVTVCQGLFRTASDRQRDQAAGIEKLLAQPEPLGLAVAAMWYKQNRLVLEAIAVNEQLAKLTPEEAIYRELAELYYQAGRDDDGSAAEAKAEELEKKAEGGQK